MLVLSILFILSACGLLAFKSGAFNTDIALFGLSASLLIFLGYNLASVIFRHIDRITLVICFFLASVGLVTLVRLDMETAVRQLIWMAIALVVMFIVVVIVKRARDFGRLNYVMLALALGLLAFAFPFAKTKGGARNWVSIGPVSFQPSEFAKVLFIIVSSYFFAANRGKWVTLGYVAFAGCALSYS